jgi:transcriptional regulator with XRE-family HTH domain
MPLVQADPVWWREGVHDGRPLREYLAARDITALFQFLRAHGWSKGAIAIATGISETRVRSIYQGRQVVASYDVLVRIAEGLGIPRGFLGLSSAEDSPPIAGTISDPHLEPGFVGSLAALAVGPAPLDLAQLLPNPRPGENVPNVVLPAHVQLVRDVRDQHRRVDALSGGGSCRDSAVNYLAWASGMLNSRFDCEETERDLKAALSDMYQVAGWACHDLGDHAAARYYLTAGLVLARQIDDLGLIAGGFYRLGRVSIHEGRAQQALKLWQLGQIVAQDSGNLASVAVLHANEAWAYAMLGSAELVCDALARAENELQRVDADTVPSWARFSLAPGELDGISGVVYACLASHREHRAYASMAIDKAERAFGRRVTGEARSQAFDAISVATGYILDGQPEQAERFGHRAVDMATMTVSVRATDRLKGMAALARPYAHRSGVTDVLDRVAALAAS